jgi:FkbM family methyltransferase
VNRETLAQAFARVLGDDLLFDLRRYRQGRRLRRGKYDTHVPERSLLAQYIPEGAVVLDIGANIGVYTRLISRIVGPRGCVHAFEPIPGTYMMLVHNVRRFEYRNVVTYHAAVTKRSGVAEMVVPPKGLLSIYWAHLRYDANDAGETIRVQALALDDIADALPRLDFVKCDAEGAELFVLQGAEHSLTSWRPALLLELGDGCRNFGYEPQQVFDWLQEHGWRPQATGADSSHSSKDPGHSPPNYLFTPTMHKVSAG